MSYVFVYQGNVREQGSEVNNLGYTEMNYVFVYQDKIKKKGGEVYSLGYTER